MVWRFSCVRKCRCCEGCLHWLTLLAPVDLRPRRLQREFGNANETGRRRPKLEQYIEGGCLRTRDASHPAFRIGNPAVIGRALRPVALRPCLSAGVPFSNELKSSHSLVCAVNFHSNSFADIVKSNHGLRIRDHKSLNFRLIVDPQAVYLPEPFTRRRCPACHFSDSVRIIRAQSPGRRGDTIKNWSVPFCRLALPACLGYFSCTDLAALR